MSGGRAAPSSVGIVEVASRFVAVVRRKVGYAGMGDAQRRARPLLEVALRAADTVPDGPPLTIWRLLDAGLVDYAPGVFVPRAIAEAGEVSLPAAWARLFAGCEGVRAPG